MTPHSFLGKVFARFNPIWFQCSPPETMLRNMSENHVANKSEINSNANKKGTQYNRGLFICSSFNLTFQIVFFLFCFYVWSHRKDCLVQGVTLTIWFVLALYFPYRFICWDSLISVFFFIFSQTARNEGGHFTWSFRIQLFVQVLKLTMHTKSLCEHIMN